MINNLKATKHIKPKATLIMMSRWPAVGRCKTRLAKSVGSENAACIQNKLIKHTISVAKELEESNLIEVRLAFSGISSKAAKRWGLENGLRQVFPQGEGSLGLRMKRQVLLNQKSRQKKNPGRGTILIGTDLPSLCRLDLIEAIEALEMHEIVLGPSLDGGYWLIGFSGKLLDPIVNWPFAGIPWGTNRVLQETLRSARRENARYKLLNVQNDIDTIEDLTSWQG